MKGNNRYEKSANKKTLTRADNISNMMHMYRMNKNGYQHLLRNTITMFCLKT